MNYKEIFEAKYNRKSWGRLLHDIFLEKADLDNNPTKVDVNSPLAKEAFYLGNITLSASQKLAVYEVALADNVDTARNRRGIRDLLTSKWRDKYVGAFVISYQKDKSLFRFSYISETWQLNENKEFQKTSTDTKRFTYLLGEGYSCRTAVEQFQKLHDSNKTLADITAAFSVEALSKEFFAKYKDHYAHFVDYMADTPALREEFIDKDFNRAGLDAKQIKDRQEKPIRDYVKKLLGRIVFLHFLQKKGWLGVPADKEWGDGDRNFMFNLFDKASEEQKQNFLDGVLEPLFADALDTDRKADNHLFDTKVEGIGTVRIPYLNGGLFERDALDEKDCCFPPKLFEDLLDTFSQYNFTIDENDPNDAEVGIDPEMLGRIFENLLEDNKDKGAFYTPKEIVQYMCRESLIAYLQTDENAEVQEGIRQFVTKHDANELTASLHERIKDKLCNVKICDPAIGSGAFPMGLLRELFFCRCALDQHLQEKAADIKRDIIQENIYGVDIERGAVDIARLRFWLALVVDEKDPSTLPNLDFKIMQGNSLLESYKGVDLSDLLKQKIEEVEIPNRQLLLIDDEIDVLRKSLNAKINKYFSCGEHLQRQQLRHDIEELVRKQLQVKGYGNVLGDVPIYENSEFFLWHTWFNDVFSREGKEGFDIVIGNPPYIKLSKNKGELSKLYADCGYDTFKKDGDIYCLFYERGYQLLKPNGHLCYITSNKWMRTDYGEKLRGFFSANTNPKLLLDFCGVQVFNSASVDTNILLFSKSPNEHKTLCAVTRKQQQGNLESLSIFVEKHARVSDFANNDIWVVLAPIEDGIKRKIETVGTPIKDWDIRINYGIKTGNNDAFIISTAKRDEILSNCQSEDERKRTEKLIRPILRGKDIKRYSYNWADKWLIATFPSCHYDIEQYPAVKAYLLSFGMERIEQTGKTYIINGKTIKARKKTNNKWFEVQDNIGYWQDFDKPKIVYSEIVQEPKFYLDLNEHFYPEATTFFMTGENLEYLIDMLNSPITGYFFRRFYAGGGLGEDGFRYKKKFFGRLPVPKPTNKVDLNDDVICSLYNLTPEEIEFIKYQLEE